MPFYFISLGSNIDPAENFRRMLAELHALTPHLAVGRIIRTEPVNLPGNSPFLNGVARLQTSLTPAALKEALNGIERRLGRDRDHPLSKIRDRVADLDILFCLAEEARAVPATLLPTESYVRPILLELLTALGYQAAGGGDGALPAGQPFRFAGQLIGQTPVIFNPKESQPR